jgi:FkbM family methyltransferase
MRLDIGRWAEAQAFLLARYDPTTVTYVLSRLPREGVLIDGGAHVGLITFQVAAERPFAHVHAFEPHPVVADRFRENLQRHEAQANPGVGTRITLNEIGLSNESGRIPFNFDAHSSHHGAPSGSIPVTSLDDYLSVARIDRVDVLKLDLEGHESPALAGAREALAAHRIGAVVIETLDAHAPLAPAHELLTTAGYCKVTLPDPRAAIVRRLRPVRRMENTAYEPVTGRAAPCQSSASPPTERPRA